jgi:hypothetical protein
MPTLGERSYTFRAAGDLGDRIREASVILGEVADADSSAVAEKIAAELVLAMVRDRARFQAVRGNQSAFMRETVELLVGAATKVAFDMESAGLYAEAAAGRANDEAEFRQAARARTAQRWRDA